MEALFNKKLVGLLPKISTTPVVSHNVASKAALDQAMGSLQDDDMLILNVHSAADRLQYPDGDELRQVSWPDLWEHVGREVPPRLSAVLIAGCMRHEESDPPIRMNEIQKIRQAFHSTIVVAPNRTYTTDVGAVEALDGLRDDKVSKKIMDDIMECYKGKMDTSEFLKRFAQQDRFSVSFGCNGYRHPLGCQCGFGMPHHLGKEVDQALSFMKLLIPKLW